MIKIYHNSRCRKSREALKIIEESGKKFEIIEYLKETLSYQDVLNIIKLLNINPIDLVRKNEAIWKQNFKNKKLSDKEIINALKDFPILIERPIVINKNKGMIGRPPENIVSIL